MTIRTDQVLMQAPLRQIGRLGRLHLLYCTMRRLTILTAALFLCVQLVACNTALHVATENVAEIALSSIGINLSSSSNALTTPKIIAMHVEGAKDLNAGADGQGLATVMRIYKLRHQNNFLSAPYASFGNAEKENRALGTDIVEVRELTLMPGQTLDLKEKMNSDAVYLGIVTLFRSPDPQRWRFAFAAADAERAGIILGVHACAMTATNIRPLKTNLVDTTLLSTAKCK